MVDAAWHAFCQAMYKGIEGEDWEELYEHFKEMSRAAGVKKPHESQKARALWKMKAAKDKRGIFMTQNARTTFWEEIKSCGNSTSKTQLGHWTEL